MAWTNTGIKNLIKSKGNQIFHISLNNGKDLFLNYPGSPRVEDLRFETIDGNDVMIVPHETNAQGKTLHFENYVTTEFIEGISIMSKEDENYRVDPFIIKL